MSHLATVTASELTGLIVGTPAYMSPEQARNQAVDQRTDIRAFGCVMYEMVSGRRAFGGDEVADIIVAVVSKEPDWSVVPRPVLRLIQDNGVIETVHQLEPDNFRGAAWTTDGSVLVSSAQTGIERLPATGGAATPLVSVGAMNPTVLPDQRHFLYVRIPRSPSDRGVFLGSLSTGPDAQSRTPLLATSADRATFVSEQRDSSAGYILYDLNGVLMAQRFDAHGLTVSHHAGRRKLGGVFARREMDRVFV